LISFTKFKKNNQSKKSKQIQNFFTTAYNY